MKTLAINTVIFMLCLFGIATILHISLLSVIGLIFLFGFGINSFERVFEELVKSFTKDTKKDS